MGLEIIKEDTRAHRVDENIVCDREEKDTNSGSNVHKIKAKIKKKEIETYVYSHCLKFGIWISSSTPAILDLGGHQPIT